MRYYNGMKRTHFIGTVLVIVLGVNLGAWTLSVATSPQQSFAPVSVPVGAPAIDAQSQTASADVPVIPVVINETIATTSTTTTATDSAQ